jgi:class 3 adenylate cyclase
MQDEELARIEMIHQENVSKLHSKIRELREEIKNTKESLEVKTKQLEEEKEKNIFLMISDLPVHMINHDIPCGDKRTYGDLCKSYDMVTLLQCDIVGFGSLLSSIEPHEAVSLIDHVQAMIDESFRDKEIFIMERYHDGCIATSGLVNPTKPDDNTNQELKHDLSSSSVSSSDTNTSSVEPTTPEPLPNAQYAHRIAMASLKLMSLSTAISIPHHPGKQLQLRVAINSGPCSAGVIGLQTTLGIHHMPHYKLFGPTINMTKKLCSTGLALQIRLGRSTWVLLNSFDSKYKFERCPDMNTTRDVLESYWLTGHEDYQYHLPSLDDAISLSNYEDIY